MQGVPVVCDADDNSCFAVYLDRLAADIIAAGSREIIIPFKCIIRAVAFYRFFDGRVVIDINIVVFAGLFTIVFISFVYVQKIISTAPFRDIDNEQTVIVITEIYQFFYNAIKSSDV